MRPLDAPDAPRDHFECGAVLVFYRFEACSGRGCTCSDRQDLRCYYAPFYALSQMPTHIAGAVRAVHWKEADWLDLDLDSRCYCSPARCAPCKGSAPSL